MKFVSTRKMNIIISSEVLEVDNKVEECLTKNITLCWIMFLVKHWLQRKIGRNDYVVVLGN